MAEYLSARIVMAWFSIAFCLFLPLSGLARRHKKLSDFFATIISFLMCVSFLSLKILFDSSLFGESRSPHKLVFNDVFNLQTLFQLAAIFIFTTLLLLLLTPLLRRCYTAESCANHWRFTSISCFVCLLAYRSRLSPSLAILRIPGWSRILFWIWAVGFAAVLLWYCVSHLRFRHTVLQNARVAPEEEWALLHSVRTAMSLPWDDRTTKPTLYRSSAVNSPLTIGLRNPVCLVLPMKDYSEEELRTIFRHELHHLIQGDKWSKLRLVVTCAAGWFIPSLWLGMKKAAEDLELCCDEVATAEMEPEQRRAYANLLLSNAGTAKGFTTCLSASAAGLRYRMARILHPQKRLVGFLPALLLPLLVVTAYGAFGFATPAGTVQEKLLDRDGGGWRVAAVGYLADYPAGEARYLYRLSLSKPIEDAIRELELYEPLYYSKDLDAVDVDLGNEMIPFSLMRDDEECFGCLYEKGLVLYEKYYMFNPSNAVAEEYLFSDPTHVDLKALRALIPYVPGK